MLIRFTFDAHFRAMLEFKQSQKVNKLHHLPEIHDFQCYYSHWNYPHGQTLWMGSQNDTVN